MQDATAHSFVGYVIGLGVAHGRDEDSNVHKLVAGKPSLPCQAGLGLYCQARRPWPGRILCPFLAACQ